MYWGWVALLAIGWIATLLWAFTLRKRCADLVRQNREIAQLRNREKTRLDSLIIMVESKKNKEEEE